MKPAGKAVTFLEILIVLIIFSIVMAIAFSGDYKKIFEKQRSLEAVSSLQLLFNTQKRYLLDSGSYFNCTACRPDEVNRALGVLLKTEYFTYRIESAGTDGVWTFNATATRRDGICQGKRLAVTDKSSEVTKECTEWK